MPKQSKVSVNKNGSQPKPREVLPERTEFYCCRCGKCFKKQARNFPASQSQLFKGNGGYLPICNSCLDDLHDHYKHTLGSDKAAIQRLCLKFDIYWSDDVYKITEKANTSSSRIRNYISKTNLFKFIGKTYDTTLDERIVQYGDIVIDAYDEAEEQEEQKASTVQSTRSVQVQDFKKKDRVITEDVVKYWGSGYTPDMYAELEDRRDYWRAQYPDGSVLDPGEDALLRQVCNLEIEINAARMAGKSIDKMVTTLNTLLGSMNLKPSQKKENEGAYIPFGVEIARWEEESPVIDPDPDFQDVDGIRKNSIAWFLGSLCKTMGIQNKYSDAFDEEMLKYTVVRPEYDDGDDDEV